jgi:hypothetical protein
MTTTLNLNTIQKLQFNDKAAAERMLLEFLHRTQDPTIVAVELFPKPESLNSINGLVTFRDQRKLFFKSHTEEAEQLKEYYNATVLKGAGYPVITSNRVNTQPGQQMAFYEIIELPSLFDLVKQEEDAISNGLQEELGQRLVKAQRNLDEQTFDVYKSTWQEISAGEHASAPVHQLFIHRLHEKGRVTNFYSGKRLKLNGDSIVFEDLATKRWLINGVEYTQTLTDLIKQSRHSLTPSAGASVIGHGDAHNGNVFVDTKENKFFLFDPAFAGRHHPIIDLTKPLFHNVFAKWMYYPEQVAKEFEISCKVSDDTVVVEHTFMPSSIREELLHSKIELVLRPTLEYFRNKNMLPNDWQELLHSSLFCCPFLTVNLFADFVPNGTLAERYTLPIKLLGLAMAIELAATPSSGTSRLRTTIDPIFR